LWADGDKQIGVESYQLGGESWQTILRGGITILDDQVCSIDPAVISQPVKPRFLNSRLRHIHGEKANPTTCPLRRRTPWRNEQRRSSRNELPPPHRITSSSRTNSDPEPGKCMPSMIRAKSERASWSAFLLRTKPQDADK
jgi:hypothetical protein